MSKEELVKLVEAIMKCEGSEKEQDAMLELLKKNVLDPQISNYIFYENNTPKKKKKKALAFKPIAL